MPAAAAAAAEPTAPALILTKEDSWLQPFEPVLLARVPGSLLARSPDHFATRLRPALYSANPNGSGLSLPS